MAAGRYAGVRFVLYPYLSNNIYLNYFKSLTRHFECLSDNLRVSSLKVQSLESMFHVEF